MVNLHRAAKLAVATCALVAAGTALVLRGGTHRTEIVTAGSSAGVSQGVATTAGTAPPTTSASDAGFVRAGDVAASPAGFDALQASLGPARVLAPVSVRSANSPSASRNLTIRLASSGDPLDGYCIDVDGLGGMCAGAAAKGAVATGDFLTHGVIMSPSVSVDGTSQRVVVVCVSTKATHVQVTWQDGTKDVAQIVRPFDRSTIGLVAFEDPTPGAFVDYVANDDLGTRIEGGHARLDP